MQRQGRKKTETKKLLKKAEIQGKQILTNHEKFAIIQTEYRESVDRKEDKHGFTGDCCSGDLSYYLFDQKRTCN